MSFVCMLIFLFIVNVVRFHKQLLCSTLAKLYLANVDQNWPTLIQQLFGGRLNISVVTQLTKFPAEKLYDQRWQIWSISILTQNIMSLTVEKFYTSSTLTITVYYPVRIVNFSSADQIARQAYTGTTVRVFRICVLNDICECSTF